MGKNVRAVKARKKEKTIDGMAGKKEEDSIVKGALKKDAFSMKVFRRYFRNRRHRYSSKEVRG